MKLISSIDEFRAATTKVLPVIIFVTKHELKEITESDLQSKIEASIPAKHKLLCDFYLVCRLNHN